MNGIPQVSRFFRAAGDVDVDKDDVKRYWDFVDEKVDDIAIAGRDSARWNGRDVIAPQDLPITRGLQEQMREFSRLDEADELRRLLRESLRRPPGDVTFGGAFDPASLPVHQYISWVQYSSFSDGVFTLEWREGSVGSAMPFSFASVSFTATILSVRLRTISSEPSFCGVSSSTSGRAPEKCETMNFPLRYVPARPPVSPTPGWTT